MATISSETPVATKEAPTCVDPHMVSFSGNGTAKFWRVAAHEEVASLRGHAAKVNAVAFGPQGRLLATASGDATIRLREPASRRAVAVLRDLGANVLALSFGPKGEWLLSAGHDGPPRLWSVSEPKVIKTFSGPASHAALGPQGRRAYFVAGGRIDVVDVATAKSVAQWQAHETPIQALALNPSGGLLATGARSGTVRAWSTNSFELLASARVHAVPIQALAFAPDGRSLVTGSQDGTLKRLDTHSLEELATLAGHLGWVTSVAFSPDGTRIVSGSRDGTVRLWDVETSCQVTVLAGHHHVWCVAFSPDGTRIASGGGATEVPGVVKLWEAPPRPD